MKELKLRNKPARRTSKSAGPTLKPRPVTRKENPSMELGNGPAPLRALLRSLKLPNVDLGYFLATIQDAYLNQPQTRQHIGRVRRYRPSASPEEIILVYLGRHGSALRGVNQTLDALCAVMRPPKPEELEKALFAVAAENGQPNFAMEEAFEAKTA